MKKFFSGAIARGRFYASAMGIITPIDAFSKKILMNTK